MGVVYLGVAGDERPVAVKVLRPHVAGDPDARRRLAREVATLRMVRHELVARVLDADVDGPLPYVATEYVRGASLDKHVKEHGALDREGLARLAYGLGEALAAVHAAGIVHRDLKPANILLRGGQPVVIDFGIAHIADDSRLTMTGLVMGTPGYLSPELIEGGHVDRATDWWGWAATVAYAATGRSPFGRGPMEAVLDRVRRGEADLSGVPGELAPVLSAALSPDPARRPKPGELRKAILSFSGAVFPSGEAATTVLGAGPVASTGAVAPTQIVAGPTGIVAAPTEVVSPGRSAPLGGLLRGRPEGRRGSVEHATEVLASGTPATRAMPQAAPAPQPVYAPAPSPTRPAEENAPRRWFGRDRTTPAERADLPRGRSTRPTGPGDTPAARALGYSQPQEPVQHRPLAPQPAHQPVAQQPAQYPVAQQPRSMPRGPVQEPAQQPPVQPAPTHDQGRKPTRTGTVFVGLVLLAVSFAAAPVLTAVIFAGWAVLARTVDRVAWSITKRRHARGRRRTDPLVGAVQSPLQMVMAALVTVFAVLLPGLLAVCGYFIVSLWAPASTGTMTAALPMAAAGGVLGVTSWWGIFGGGLRRGSRAVIRGLTPGGLGSVFAVCLLGVLVATALAALWHGNWEPNWYPLAQDPLQRLVGETPRDLLPSLTGR